jgi:glycopeptide antibiotics resistance protein
MDHGWLGSRDYPWFLPGVMLAIVVGAIAARPLARALSTRPAVAWLLITSLGIALAATLTPQTLAGATTSSGTCDLARIGLAPWDELLAVSDSSLNVLLFVPLGLAIGLLPRSRRRTMVAGAALLLPVAIEATQVLVPALHRICQSADVVDNLLGLAIGLGAGIVVRRVAGAADRRDR